MMNGLDYLGMGHPKWPTDLTIQSTPKGWAIGVFDTTFGDVLPALQKHLASGKFPAARIQLWYDSSHCLCPIDIIQARAPLYEKLAKQFPAVKIYLSHSCEYKDSNADSVKKRTDLLQKLAPSCIPVNTIWAGPGSAGVMQETHDCGGKISGLTRLHSTDGANAPDLDMNAWQNRFSGAEIRFLWAYRFNAKGGDKDPNAPKDRFCFPDNRYIKGLIRMADSPGAPCSPKFKGKVQAIKEPMLWKVYAEDSPTQDIRSNKPCFICPSKAKQLSVIDFTGKEVSVLRWFGPFENGPLQRFYSGTGSNLYGYQIAAQAKKQSGSEWVWITDGKNFYGPINPAFRAGSFR